MRLHWWRSLLPVSNTHSASVCLVVEASMTRMTKNYENSVKANWETTKNYENLMKDHAKIVHDNGKLNEILAVLAARQVVVTCGAVTIVEWFQCQCLFHDIPPIDCCHSFLLAHFTTPKLIKKFLIFVVVACV
jgi:hypothetical protein